MKKNKILLIAFIALFIGINKANALSYYCQDGYNIPFFFEEQDYDYNKQCKYPWTDESYMKPIFMSQNVNFIEMKDFREVFLNDGLGNTDVVRLVGNNTIELIGSLNENQKWLFIGEGNLIIKKASVRLTEAGSSVGSYKEDTTYDTPEGLLEYAERFITTDLDISTTDDGYLKISGNHSSIDVIEYDDLNNLLQDKKQYADPDNIDITPVISGVGFYNNVGDIIDVPVMAKQGPGYFQRTYAIDENIYKYYLVISTSKYVGDEIKLANLNFEFYTVNKINGKYNYMYRVILNSDLLNNYNNQSKKNFMVLDSELYEGKRIQNTLYLLFDSDVKELMSEMDNTIITDDSTGIKLEASAYNLERGTKLAVDEITNESMKIMIENAINDETKSYKAYDISLLSNDNLNKQPFGNVLISIPIPTGMNKEDIHVYWITNSGTKVEYECNVEGDYVTFETDHFSTYVITGNESYIKGDMNRNGKIDLQDIIILLKKYLGTLTTTDEDKTIGDMDNNGSIGLKDIILLLRTYLGSN